MKKGTDEIVVTPGCLRIHLDEFPRRRDVIALFYMNQGHHSICGPRILCCLQSHFFHGVKCVSNIVIGMFYKSLSCLEYSLILRV